MSWGLMRLSKTKNHFISAYGASMAAKQVCDRIKCAFPVEEWKIIRKVLKIQTWNQKTRFLSGAFLNNKKKANVFYKIKFLLLVHHEKKDEHIFTKSGNVLKVLGCVLYKESMWGGDGKNQVRWAVLLYSG